MSVSKNRYQAERWLLTAKEDMEAAQVLLERGMYAHACFLFQQSGEKAVKALWYFADEDPWGHSIKRLLSEFPHRNRIENVDDWLEWAAFLDQFYIPTRYPNGLPDLTPGQVYSKEDAERCREAAHRLVSACEQWLRAQ